MNYSIEDKYQFLLNLFRVTSVDLWEQDAMFTCVNSMHYFQFGEENITKDIDKVVELIMAARGL